MPVGGEGRSKKRREKRRREGKRTVRVVVALAPKKRGKRMKTHWTPLQTVHTKMLKLVTTYCGPCLMQR